MLRNGAWIPVFSEDRESRGGCFNSLISLKHQSPILFSTPEIVFYPWFPASCLGIFILQKYTCMEKDDLKEKLEAENDFMKMKLMLERGAEFGGGEDQEVDPLIENMFLKNVIEFEKQCEERKTIRLFDKIGKPEHFKPADQIPDEEISKEWENISGYLLEHGISLGVCSPNISKRELYRFTVEELFAYEMDDIDVPGLIHGFIYDEFHPDHLYDNARMAMEDCISIILRKEPMEWTMPFRDTDLRLNDRFPLAIGDLKDIINRFKSVYDDIDLEDLKQESSIIENDQAWVEGSYLVKVRSGKELSSLSGNWKVALELHEEMEYWRITSVFIENIAL
jgi:hypothetical protein